MRHALAARLIGGAVLVAGPLLVAAPAGAASRVTVTNPDGAATIDPTYSTTLRVSGSGFQSVQGGHGGIYVFFGTVRSGWQPSKGGATGSDYFYVPDEESKDNQGFQRFVAFPGSDTASSANGGTMSANGGWSTSIVVPGATFQTYDRDGDVTTIDCREVTCGIITVGAHGVTNAHNETFTPVKVAATATEPTATPTAAATSGSTASADPTTSEEAPAGGATPKPGKPSASAAPAALEVDRASAVAGNVLAFTATGLTPGVQVSAVFDDGAAGAGPFVAGAEGSLAGVITLPADTGPGTHELRLYGAAEPPTVSFAVRAAETSTDSVEPRAAEDDQTRAAWLFAGASALVLLVALARLGVRAWRGRRRAAA